jgi:phenylacetate-CoA ligase
VTPSAPVFANDPELLDSSEQHGNSLLPPSLESEIRRIYSLSPLYPKRFPLHADPLHWGCYREIPALSKKDIVTFGHEAFFEDYKIIEQGLSERRYEYESTSGTTQGPMTVIMEEGWWNAQTARAYRAHPLLAPYADRPHRKCVLAPVGCSSNLCPYEDHPFPHRYFDGVVYLNLTSDPFVFPESEWDRIVTELQAVRPEIIEGEPIYLSLLARAVLRRRVSVPSLRVAILTYGKASLTHSRRIAEAFPSAEQVDLYGSTEAGYIFVGDAFHDNSKVIDENVFVELTPYRQLKDVFQLYVTTRGREAMPLLRYHTGDVVRRFSSGYRVLGREGSLHFREDGEVVSPTEIDQALPADFVCWHYSLTQTGESRWNFDYVAEQSAPEGLTQAIARVLGDGTRVSAFRKRLIAPAASGKFALLKPVSR